MIFRVHSFEQERARRKPILGHVEFTKRMRQKLREYERARATDVIVKEIPMTTKVSIKSIVRGLLKPHKGITSFALSANKSMSGVVQNRKLKAKWRLSRDEDGETILLHLNGVFACNVESDGDVFDAADKLFASEKQGEVQQPTALGAKLSVFQKKLREVKSTTVVTLTDEVVLPTRLEGTIQFLGGQLFDWWVVERDNKIWLCSDGRDEAERLKDIASFYGLLQADSEALASRKPRVLLIWELIPERTEMYLIPADDPVLSIVRAAQGQYINHVDLEGDAAVYDLSEWLNTDDAQAFKTETPIKARIKEVIQAGFLC